MLAKRFGLIGPPKKPLIPIYRNPEPDELYFDFFNSYAKKNYQWVDTKCLCGNHNDKLISTSDRHGIEYHCVICQSCGLIRPKKYLRDEDIKDFYTNHYRDTTRSKVTPANSKWKVQSEQSLYRKKLIRQYGNFDFYGNKTAVDIGGAAGGFFDGITDSTNCILFDYFEPYLNYAESMGVKTIKGGLDKLNNANIKPDLIVINHVVEHWNNFEYEIEQLIKASTVNKTIIYIEFPGVDSLKTGRRGGDLLGDIHIPHFYYFASYVFVNIMERFGFESLYCDDETRAIFKYTGKKKKLVDNYSRVWNDLIEAEKTKKIYTIKHIIRLFIPNFILSLKRKLIPPKIVRY